MSQPEKFESVVATYAAMLCEAFGRNATKATFMAYEAGLSGLTTEQVKTACLATLKQNRQFMPTPGELREIGLSGGTGFDALVASAWECLNRGIDSVGYSGSLNFMDGLINATVRHLGGWERACGLPVEEFSKWYRKDFERTYLNFLRNGCPTEQLRYLKGANERENAKYHGKTLPGGGTYQLPDIEQIGAPYAPQVLALPAPERTAVDIPRIEFRTADPDPEQPEAKPTSKMKHKNDFPKHLQWTEKADLEYELTPEQLETQARNRKMLESLK